MARQEGTLAPGLRARLALAFAGALFAAAPARAQQPPPTPEDLADRARIRFGPFYLQTWMMVTNAGLDTNVFNDSEEPKEDYTFTLTPGLDGGMRAGVARLNVRAATDYVWYRIYKSEQGVDGATRLQFELRGAWLRPFVVAEWVNTRSRPGYEIDARAERNTPSYEGGVDVRIASRTWIVLAYRQGKTQFLAGEVYQNVALDQALNNTTKTANAGLRLDVSPLTSLTLSAQLQRVRFDSAAIRDNDNYAFLSTLDFSPDALLTGRASVGYRSLQAQAAGAPDYRGVVANVNLNWTALSSTSLGFGVERDVAYSFEVLYPYYLQNGVNASVTQRLVGSLEAAARGRHAWLDYQVLENAALQRSDRVTSYGGGIGYRFGDQTRLGLDVEQVERHSDLPDRQYRGLRVFGSVRYGF